MSGKSGSGFSELEIYKRYESLSELLWDMVESWPRRFQSIIGDQMLRAADSIGANIAEGVGRGHYKECLHHLYYARGSLAETQHWIRIAVRRKLVVEARIQPLRELSSTLHKQLNAFIAAQRPRRTANSTGDSAAEISPSYGRMRQSRRKLQEPRAKSQELLLRSSHV